MSASAGCRSFSLFDEPSGRAVPMRVMYPSDAPEQGTQLGSYTLDMACDGPIAAGTFPLVVISHVAMNAQILAFLLQAQPLAGKNDRCQR